MSVLDHSLTYRQFKLRNIPHIIRLKKILRIIKKELNGKNIKNYLDVGCSNGYITNIISSRCKVEKACGVDHNLDNLKVGKNKYKNIDFSEIDLNHVQTSIKDKYDLVTCFETLEHVGNPANAIRNLYSFASDHGSMILISVPVEVGFWGVVKYLLKLCIKYNVDELANGATKGSYFKTLLFGGDIGKYRDQREGWGTHFGFDFHQIDKILNEQNIPYQVKRSGTSRFYIIKK